MQPTDPGGQPRTFTVSARRAQIVQAAIETIAELGFGPASYAQIARRAGLSSTGLISYHFASKDELIEQVVAEVLDTARAFMAPRIEAVEMASDRLRVYIESNLDFFAQHREPTAAVVAIFDASPTGPHGQPGPYAAHHGEVIADLARELQAGQRSGELTEFSPRVMAVAIRAAIDAVGRQIVADPELDLAGHSRELSALFDRATRAAPDRR